MKKQLFTLLTLLVMCVTGAWGDPTYYTPEADEVIILTNVYDKDASTANYSKHAGVLFYANNASFSSKTVGDPDDNTKTLSGNSLLVKNNGDVKRVTLNITGVKKITVYHESHNLRYVRLLDLNNSNTVLKAGSASTYYTELELTGTTNYSIRLEGYDGNAQTDLGVYAVKIEKYGASKTTLAGGWTNASPSFIVGSSATIPTFSVTGGGELGTDYTVAYSEVSDANNIVTTEASNGITAISTSAEGTATIRAKVALTETGAESYSLETTTYDITISVIDATPYSTPTITEKNGTVQITSPDDGVVVSQIKYSLDNGETWEDYSIPFNLNEAKTVMAKVVTGTDASKTDSEVASAECNAIPAAAAGSMSITLYHDASNWIKTASISGSGKNDTWTGKASTYLEGYSIVLDNVGKEGSNIKDLASGSAINSKSTIKGSNGRTLTFALPTGVKVNRITVYSYTNGDDDNHYTSGWKFNGSTADMIGLSLMDKVESNVHINAGKSMSTASNPDVRVFYFATPLEGSFDFVNSGYQQCFYMVLDYTQTVTATITLTGYATFSSPYALDFTGNIDGLEKVYYASAVAPGSVTMTEINQTVPAETGLFLKGTAGETITIPVVASGDELPGTNYLKPTTSSAITASANGIYHYVFAYNTNSDSYNAGFYNLSSDVTPGVGKAYIETTTDIKPSSTPQAKVNFLLADGGLTGVKNIDASSNINANTGKMYNLGGQLVNGGYKGIVIVNGKKVVK